MTRQRRQRPAPLLKEQTRKAFKGSLISVWLKPAISHAQSEDHILSLCRILNRKDDRSLLSPFTVASLQVCGQFLSVDKVSALTARRISGKSALAGDGLVLIDMTNSLESVYGNGEQLKRSADHGMEKIFGQVN